MEKLPKATIDYVIAHINDRPRRKVAEQCDISMSTLYRIIRENGGELRHDLCYRHEGIEDTIRELWPSMTAREIARKTGISKSVVLRWHKRLGVEHTAETEARIKRERDETFQRAKLATSQAKKVKAWRHTRRMDEWRVLGGQPQQTKFKIKLLPDKVYRTMWYLEDKYNYFFENDRPVVYFDSQTRRAKNESRFTEKYGIRFEQACEA